MPSRVAVFAASAFVGAAMVAAQAAPNWIYIPKACSSQCSQTVEAAYTCQNQFSGDTTNIYGCFCNNYPSDSSTCADCLNSNNAAALGSLLTSTQTACPEAIKSCFFQCSFDTCPSSDVACQCDGTYLANIYNCASCNTANNNAGTTQITDFNNLEASCKAQNYTGAAQSFATKALPVASTDNYSAPELTATGGGVAATGDASAIGAVSGAASVATGNSPTTMSGAKTSKTSAAGSGATSAAGASAASAGGSAASAAPSSGAMPVVKGAALTGVIGLLGAAVAVL